MGCVGFNYVSHAGQLLDACVLEAERCISRPYSERDVCQERFNARRGNLDFSVWAGPCQFR